VVRAEVEGRRVMHPAVDLDLRTNHATLRVRGMRGRPIVAPATPHFCL
jgi:hypothetical protein